MLAEKMPEIVRAASAMKLARDALGTSGGGNGAPPTNGTG